MASKGKVWGKVEAVRAEAEVGVMPGEPGVVEVPAGVLFEDPGEPGVPGVVEVPAVAAEDPGEPEERVVVDGGWFVLRRVFEVVLLVCERAGVRAGSLLGWAVRPDGVSLVLCDGRKVRDGLEDVDLSLLGDAGDSGGKCGLSGDWWIVEGWVWEVVARACAHFDVSPDSLHGWCVRPREVQLVLDDGRRVSYSLVEG